MITMSRLSCRRGEITLFEPLDLQVQPGQYVELVGRNGAGKTTLLRTLTGIHQQYQGQFEISSFLFQGHRLGLDGLLNPLENLTWQAALVGRQVNEQQLQDVLQRVDMLEYALTPLQTLSQGQQRRIAMAKWLLSDARVWLLDEPLTALDSNAQALLVSMLQSHCEGQGAVLCATHSGLAIADKLVLSLQPLTN